MKRKIIIGLISLLFTLANLNTIYSQSKVSDDKIAIVKFKNGSTVEGEILEWNIDESITLKFAWGGVTTLYQEQIKKITQKSTLNSHKAIYSFKEKGLYYSVRMHLISGNDGSRAHGTYGSGISFSVGRRFNRLFALGGGIGYDRYIWDSGENLIPLFVELTGYFNRRNSSFFYNLQSGYSFAMKDDQYLLTKAKGGFMVYPNIGLRWGTQQHSYQVSVGYKFQNAEFTYSNPWTFGERSKQNILFKRLSLSFGVLL